MKPLATTLTSPTRSGNSLNRCSIPLEPDVGAGDGAIRYILKADCQWSLLPRYFPPKSTVQDALVTWTREGVWPRINTVLRERVRVDKLKKRHAQRGDHRQPERQGRAAPRHKQHGSSNIPCGSLPVSIW